MTNKTINYTDFLNWVDVDEFADDCNNISNSPGSQCLNQHSNRMMKEKFILSSLKVNNHAKNIQLVDTIDYDLIFSNWVGNSAGSTVEVKTGDGPMFTAKRGNPKEFVEVKLKNIYESKANTRTTLDKTFDHLMIIQNSGKFAIGFVPFGIVTDHLISLSDGWKARIPFEKVNIIYTKDVRNSPITWTEDMNPYLMVESAITKARATRIV